MKIGCREKDFCRATAPVAVAGGASPLPEQEHEYEKKLK